MAQAIKEETKGLPEHEFAAVWFQTSKGEEWASTEGDDQKEPYLNRQLFVAVIRDGVLSKENSHTNFRICKYINQFE
ncbi:hypothetical protein SH467x_001369 [Pirellulaceae bacterium SH467]